MLYVLYEQASGYALFEAEEAEGVALQKESVQEVWINTFFVCLENKAKAADSCTMVSLF